MKLGVMKAMSNRTSFSSMPKRRSFDWQPIFNLLARVSALVALLLIASTNVSLSIEPILITEFDGDLQRDQFGFSVSTESETVVIGAPWAWSNGVNSGTVYVYDRNSSNSWGEPVQWSGEEAFHNFGWSVSLDGEVFIVGAPYTVPGSAYVFERSENGEWEELLKWTGERPGDKFGMSVSIDGDTAVIGAPEETGEGIEAGAAYVFKRGVDGIFGDPVKLSGTANYGGFGTAVSIENNTIVVGSPWDNAAYVFVHGGNGWGKPVKLSGPRDSYFGWSVDVDGDVIAVGATGIGPGSVYVYVRGEGSWDSWVELTGEVDKDGFGNAVSVSGKTIVVGASFADKNGRQSGSAYVFDLDGCGNWRNQSELVGSVAFDLFGESVSLSSDGSQLVVGGTARDSTDENVGYVRMYDTSAFNYFRINPGINDAWYNQETDGQGFFITALPESCQSVIAWFTYDTDYPPNDAVSNLGDPGHRWMTALGPIDGNKATMEIDLTSNGLFDTSTEVQHTDPPGADGRLILTMDSCISGTLEYEIPSIGKTGVIPIQRVASDNIELCEMLSSD